MDTGISFIKAESEGEKAVFQNILLTVANDLEVAGKMLWTREDLVKEKIFAAGDPYICIKDGMPAGTFILVDRDPLFWPEVTDGSTMFVHKVSVAIPFRGSGVSRSILEFAKGVAVKRGKRFLRLDCRSERLKLRHVYESFGFQFVGLAYLIDKTNALYEIQLPAAHNSK